MAHCACFLGMSNVKKTLSQTQYVVEECHFPILLQGGVQPLELEEVAAWEEHRPGFLAKMTSLQQVEADLD